MQQAVEAKEGLAVSPSRSVCASITLQGYLCLYGKLAGMTGTARAEAAEYRRVYGLDVVEIPTDRPIARIDHPDQVYATEQARDIAVAGLVAERHERGQPILIGTRSVLESDRISALLTERGIGNTVLNAANPESQASVIALAGHRFAVTVITGMAGRGTDIELGDRPEEYDAVCALGGLLVIGTGRHLYRRLDDHLRGRAGRRGDPGESQFLLDIECLTNVSPRARRLAQHDLALGDTQLMMRVARRGFDTLQDTTERQALEDRARYYAYDKVINEQRLRIYAERRTVLEGIDLRPRLRDTLDTVIERFVADAARDTPPEFAGLDALARRCQTYYKASVSAEHLAQVPDLAAYLKADAQRAYQRKEQELGSEVMREFERRVVLSVIDRATSPKSNFWGKKSAYAGSASETSSPNTTANAPPD
ncbi:MAG: preprotein translocase, SecA subunit [Actinomycetia bacterium]|nr:preprotein translocase, SecA subunit [Actinomycetes bacterium]